MNASTPARSLLLLGAALLLVTGCGRREDALSRVRRTKVLTIGTDATYPPFESVRNGQFEGFSIDLGRALARELGAEAQFVNTAFDGIFPALLVGKFDLVISSVTITEERKRQLAFSDPYYTAGQIVAVRASETGIRELADLVGRTAGIQINTTAAEVLKEHPGIQVRKYASIDQALLDLRNGNVQGVVGDAPTIRYFLAHGFSDLRTVGELLSEEEYGIVLRPDDVRLRDAVNGALARLRGDGRFSAIESRWFGGGAGEGSAAAPDGIPWISILRSLLAGLWLTLQLTALALVGGIPLGLLLALARQARFPPLRWLAAGYVELVRGTPLLVQIIFVYYSLPGLLGVNLPAYSAAVLALGLNCAAYVAEIFRAGIQSIDAGQMEAARSLGMTYGLAMRFVVLPQAFQRVLPPLTNEGIALLKDTSLVAVIGMADLARSGQELASSLGLPLVVWPAVAVCYLAMTFPLTRLAAALERRWAHRTR